MRPLPPTRALEASAHGSGRVSGRGCAAIAAAGALLAAACGQPPPVEEREPAAWPLAEDVTFLELSREEQALAERGPERPPDVVLLVVDTLRADAVLDPEGRFDTPNLDGLGREGLVFREVFSHAPMTLPSHSSLFSSRPPHETEVRNNQDSIRPDLPLLADWLGQHGYESRAVISMGTLSAHGAPGIDRGFESYDERFLGMARGEDSLERLEETLDRCDPQRPLFLFAHFSDPHVPYNAHGRVERWAELELDGEPLHRFVVSDMAQFDEPLELGPGRHSFVFRSDEPCMVRAFGCYVKGAPLKSEWIESKPLTGGTLHRVDVTVPSSEGPAVVQLRYWVNDVLYGRSKAMRYLWEVNYVDRVIGEFLGKLRDRGLYDDALIVFTSDHGESLGEHDGFYGHVEFLTDEQIHVPLIVKLPAGDPRGALLARSLERVVSHVDVTPTILDLAGLPGLPGQRGTTLLRPHVTVHLAETHKPEAPHSKIALRDGRYKMIYWIEEGRFVMYDLQADPGETTDVFSTARVERPEWVGRLALLGSVGPAASEGSGSAERLELLKQLGY